MLISLLVALLAAALVYWVAGLILPHPIPAVAATVVLIAWLLNYSRIH